MNVTVEAGGQAAVVVHAAVTSYTLGGADPLPTASADAFWATLPPSGSSASESMFLATVATSQRTAQTTNVVQARAQYLLPCPRHARQLVAQFGFLVADLRSAYWHFCKFLYKR